MTIQGAGMWYSTIYYSPPLPATSTNNVILPTSSKLKSFAIDGNAVAKTRWRQRRRDQHQGEQLARRQHMGRTRRGGSLGRRGPTGTVQNCRLNNTWADGINLNNGNGATNNNIGNNLTAMNNFIRGSGDDGLAINDGQNPGAEEMNNMTLVQNTVIAPWWADNIGVYGGMNDLVANNLCTDSIKEYGINIGLSQWSRRISRRPIFRATSSCAAGTSVTACIMPPWVSAFRGRPSTITSVTFCGNTIDSPLFDGIEVNTGTDLTVSGNLISGMGATGINLLSGAGGGVSLVCNTVQNVAAGQSAYLDDAGSGFPVSGTGNIGLHSMTCACPAWASAEPLATEPITPGEVTIGL